MERREAAGIGRKAAPSEQRVVDSLESIDDPGVEPLAVLFAERYVPLVRLAVLLGASQEVAEEKVMDAFAGLTSRIGEVAAPTSYLRTAVVNGVRSHHRRLRTVRRQPRPRPQVLEDPDLDDLWDRLGSLSRQERMCVVLRYYEDLPIGEIALVLDMPVGTVKSHLHRAIAALRDLLNEEDT